MSPVQQMPDRNIRFEFPTQYPQYSNISLHFIFVCDPHIIICLNTVIKALDKHFHTENYI